MTDKEKLLIEENIKAMRENMSPEDMKDFDRFIDTAWGD